MSSLEAKTKEDYSDYSRICSLLGHTPKNYRENFYDDLEILKNSPSVIYKDSHYQLKENK